MCLAVPAQIIRLLEEEKALVDMDGVHQCVSMALCPEAKPGEYVVVHIGFALSVLDEEEALRTLALLEGLPSPAGDGPP